MIADPLRPAVPGVRAGKRCYARCMPGWIGPWELAILLVVVLLVFGPKRLPEMGKSLGRGMREFKHSISGKDDEDEPSHAQLTSASQQDIATPTPSSREHDPVS